jgi:hypothetical protein
MHIVAFSEDGTPVLLSQCAGWREKNARMDKLPLLQSWPCCLDLPYRYSAPRITFHFLASANIGTLRTYRGLRDTESMNDCFYFFVFCSCFKHRVSSVAAPQIWLRPIHLLLGRPRLLFPVSLYDSIYRGKWLWSIRVIWSDQQSLSL